MNAVLSIQQISLKTRTGDDLEISFFIGEEECVAHLESNQATSVTNANGANTKKGDGPAPAGVARKYNWGSMKSADAHVEIPFVSYRRLLDSHVRFQIWKVGRRNGAKRNGGGGKGSSSSEEIGIDGDDPMNQKFGEEPEPVSSGGENGLNRSGSRGSLERMNGTGNSTIRSNMSGMGNSTGTSGKLNLSSSRNNLLNSDEDAPTSPFSRQNKKIAEGKWEFRKLGMMKPHLVTPFQFAFNEIDNLPEDVILDRRFINEDAVLVGKMSWGWMEDGAGPPASGEPMSKEREAELQKRRDRAELVRAKERSLSRDAKPGGKGNGKRQGVVPPPKGKGKGKGYHDAGAGLGASGSVPSLRSTGRSHGGGMEEEDEAPATKSSLFARNEARRKKREQLSLQKKMKDEDATLSLLRKGMIKLRIDLRDLNGKYRQQSDVNLIRVSLQQGDVAGDLLERGIQCDLGDVEFEDGNDGEKENVEIYEKGEVLDADTAGVSKETRFARTNDSTVTGGSTVTRPSSSRQGSKSTRFSTTQGGDPRRPKSAMSGSVTTIQPPKKFGTELTGVEWAYKSSNIAHPGVASRAWNGAYCGPVDANPPVDRTAGRGVRVVSSGSSMVGKAGAGVGKIGSIVDQIKQMGMAQLPLDTCSKPDFSRWRPGGGMISRGCQT